MITGLHGYNKSDGTEKLIATQGNRVLVYDTNNATWVNQSQTHTSGSTPSFATFLDYAFLVNGVNPNLSYDGSSWSSSTLVVGSPQSYGIVSQANRLFLLKPTILNTVYKSRVWHSDLPGAVTNNGLTWGYEEGSDLATTADSGVVTSASAKFIDYNIKVGDPFYITTDGDVGKYTVQSVDSNTQITLVEDLTATDTNVSYWVGRNWFDVKTSDGDDIVTAVDNFNELVIYKRNSVHRYNQFGNELRQIKKVKGTTSAASVIAEGDYCYHYHPSSGIIKMNASGGIIISAPIEDLIDNMSASNATAVVGWVERDRLLKWYIGDTSTREGKSISNCVIKYDTTTEQWSWESLPFAVTSATEYYESNISKVYIGADDNGVYNTPSGYAFGTVNVDMEVGTHPIFPAGEDAVVDFTRVRLYMDNPSTVTVLYRLIYKPANESNTKWTNDTEWQTFSGRTNGHRVELYIPDGKERRASGIEIKIAESSNTEGPTIKKLLIYYSNVADV